MSAFMVDKTHIDALLTAATHRAYNRYGPMYFYAPGLDDAIRVTDETVGMIGAALLSTNRDSVNYRYEEEEIEEVYEYEHMQGYPHPIAILNALRCYEYQASEHPGYPESMAKAFVDGLTRSAIRLLAGDEDTWEITDRNHFLKAAVLA